MYNLKEAGKYFIKTAAYLARDVSFTASRKPLRLRAQRKLEDRIERWRASMVMIIQQQQTAHKRIAELERQLRISKCCENENCDRKDCPMMAKP